MEKDYSYDTYRLYARGTIHPASEERGFSLSLDPEFINVKTLFTLMHRLEKPPGMAESLKLIGIPLQGTHHRAGR
ncbi:MAG: hypothetical protein OI715_00735 (plasmid) [Candidatus Methanoperedens sp.]|nr:MAG: hypothetical protein OI715_00735 [Candidatus Methanoperedens sp.]